jgi:hypothetical protein
MRLYGFRITVGRSLEITLINKQHRKLLVSIFPGLRSIHWIPQIYGVADYRGRVYRFRWLWIAANVWTEYTGEPSLPGFSVSFWIARGNKHA